LLPSVSNQLTWHPVSNTQITKNHKEATYIEIVPDSSQNTLSALESFMFVRNYKRSRLENGRTLLAHHSCLFFSLPLSSFDRQRNVSRQAEQYQLEALLATDKSPNSHNEFYKLGSFYRAMGHHEKAVPQFQACLKRREAQFGRKSLEVATVLDRLGACYTAVGDTSRALEHLNAALSIVLSLSGSHRELGKRGVGAWERVKRESSKS
jgi:tetratricopeptide (TPR) repeat protein